MACLDGIVVIQHFVQHLKSSLLSLASGRAALDLLFLKICNEVLGSPLVYLELKRQWRTRRASVKDVEGGPECLGLFVDGGEKMILCSREHFCHAR